MKCLKNIPVIGPSLTSKEAFQAVGDLDQYIDHPNLAYLSKILAWLQWF